MSFKVRLKELNLIERDGSAREGNSKLDRSAEKGYLRGEGLKNYGSYTPPEVIIVAWEQCSHLVKGCELGRSLRVCFFIPTNSIP